MQNKITDMILEKIPELHHKRALTHSGTFHADDVMSAALLKAIFDDIHIERKGAVPPGYQGLIFDIGGGRYDHHGGKSEFRNDVPYAAFGKLWRDIGPLVMKDWKKFDASFVQKIDYADNTGRNFPTVSILIASYNTDDVNGSDQDKRFFELVDIFSRLIRTHIDREYAKEQTALLLKKEYKRQGEIILLDKYLPHDAKDIPPNVRFLIFPCRDGVMAKSCSAGRKQILFPVPWCGAEKQYLEKAESGLIFCHPSGRMIVAKDAASAKRICQSLCRKAEPAMCTIVDIQEGEIYGNVCNE